MIAERIAAPEQLGLSPTRLRRIDDVMQRFIERDVIAGAVTLLARNEQVVHLEAHGLMDIASSRPMQRDAIFRLASMTKPVISVAILILLEEGKLLLTEPVANFVPELRDLQVQVPNPPTMAGVPTQLTAGEFHVVPANRLITIRDLLTHTSGLGSAMAGPAFTAATEIQKSTTLGQTLEEVVPRFASTPLSFQPGTVWEYSGAFGFELLGRIIEVVSGLELSEFFRQRIFEPLGMRDTAFNLPGDGNPRVASVYERNPAGGLRAGQGLPWLDMAIDPKSRYRSGGGGLVGTAEDYARFAMMLANGGRLGQERILSRHTVELMASNHIGQLPLDRAVSDMRGYRFGLGVRVLDTPAEASTLASRGTFGWAGAFGTNSWIDPVERLVGIMLIQRTPDPTDTVLRGLWPRLQTAAYQALED
jgi:CubicO group peptidase (beta-lactamase class C family)